MSRNSSDKGVEKHSGKEKSTCPCDLSVQDSLSKYVLNVYCVHWGKQQETKQIKIPALLELIISDSSSQLGTILSPTDTWQRLRHLWRHNKRGWREGMLLASSG